METGENMHTERHDVLLLLYMSIELKLTIKVSSLPRA